MKDFSLEGRSALVTGSSRGIGNAIARAYQEAGARVVFHGIEEEPPAALAGELYVRQDLLEQEAARKLVDQAFSLAPDIDSLVCNAGSFFDVSFLEMTDERWDKTINLNLKAGYFIIQAFARHLVEAGREGSVVVITSTNGVQAEIGSTAYDASKGGLVMLVKSLALNLADHGIRVNGVAPGLIRTPLTGWLDRQPEKREHYEKKIALGRIGQPEECAGACAFLASPAARYITGEIITVDGGLTISQIGKM